MQLFVRMLTSTIRKAVRCAAAAVWVLSSDNEDNCALLNSLFAPRMLFKLAAEYKSLKVKDLEDAEILEYVVLAMSSLAKSHLLCREQFIRNGVLDMFSSLLESYDGHRRIQIMALAALPFFITTNAESYGARICKVNRLLVLLVNLLCSSHVESRHHAAVSLMRLVQSKWPGMQDAIRETGALWYLVSTVRIGTGSTNKVEEFAAREAVLALGSLSGCPAIQEMVHRLGGVELLVIASKGVKPAESNTQTLDSAAAKVLQDLCRGSRTNTKAFEDAMNRDWQDLTCRVFGKQAQRKYEKDICTSDGVQCPKVRQGNAENNMVPTSVCHAAASNPGAKGGGTQQQASRVRNSNVAASSGRQTRGRFDLLEIETSAEEQRKYTELLKRKKRLKKLLSEIESLRLRDRSGEQLNIEQRMKLGREGTTVSLLEQVDAELEMRSEQALAVATGS